MTLTGVSLKAYHTCSCSKDSLPPLQRDTLRKEAPSGCQCSHWYHSQTASPDQRHFLHTCRWFPPQVAPDFCYPEPSYLGREILPLFWVKTWAPFI